VSDTGSSYIDGDIKDINKKQELPKTAMFVNGSKRKEQFP
jgi:hypothetical protein